MSNCYASYENPPNLSVLESYVFTIDNVEYYLDAPTGGNVGKHNIFQFNSEGRKEQHHILFTIGFDRFVSANALYDLTYIYFGLTKKGCCGIDSIRDFENANGNKTKTIIVNKKKMLYVEKSSNKNDLIAKIYLPYDEEYNMFFTLRINNKIAEDTKLVEFRLQILKNIVNSFRRSDSSIRLLGSEQ